MDKLETAINELRKKIKGMEFHRENGSVTLEVIVNGGGIRGWKIKKLQEENG